MHALIQRKSGKVYWPLTLLRQILAADLPPFLVGGRKSQDLERARCAKTKLQWLFMLFGTFGRRGTKEFLRISHQNLRT
jgi:hypothetical protein